jgi:hypothetical protein
MSYGGPESALARAPPIPTRHGTARRTTIARSNNALLDALVLNTKLAGLKVTMYSVRALCVIQQASTVQQL